MPMNLNRMQEYRSNSSDHGVIKPRKDTPKINFKQIPPFLRNFLKLAQEPCSSLENCLATSLV
ncbi:hypothetical protein A6X21_01925 [Planctopirus hydrillae]|uniref:Uncharacterized protein n=1 Tax=Planctopirus hydrillae TaxID=1841610 RepID=A0A1C3ET30_9PLAN|nr:hypothetical protein A6X21_01925 [Planctopirus hydrillae]